MHKDESNRAQKVCQAYVNRIAVSSYSGISAATLHLPSHSSQLKLHHVILQKKHSFTKSCDGRTIVEVDMMIVIIFTMSLHAS